MITHTVNYEWCKPAGLWTQDELFTEGLVAIASTAGPLVLVRVEEDACSRLIWRELVQVDQLKEVGLTRSPDGRLEISK